MSIIDQKFIQKKLTPSDIYEHLDTLFEYAKKCNSVAELGVRDIVSSYAFAAARPDTLICLDINRPSNINIFLEECKNEKINVKFIQQSTLDYEFDDFVDLLFIDTLHTYKQLTEELRRHQSKVVKYIIMHDTSGPWANRNEDPNTGHETDERGPTVGLKPAVADFLKQQSEWIEARTYLNNNGLTILERNNKNI